MLAWSNKSSKSSHLNDSELRKNIFIKMNLAVAVIALLASLLLLITDAKGALAKGTLAIALFSVVFHFLQKKINHLGINSTIYFIAWLTFTVIISTRTGGLKGPMAFAFLPLPIVALIFYSLAGAIFWSLFTITIYLGLYWKHNEFNTDNLQNLIFISAVTIAILTIGGIFQSLTENANVKTNDALKKLTETQTSLLSTARLSSLGEMAAGIAHEINTPLASIKNISSQIAELLDDKPIDKELLKKMARQIEDTSNRIAKIVSGLRVFSRDGKKDPTLKVNLHQLLNETLDLCSEKLKSYGIKINIMDFNKDIFFEGRATEISQVLFNFLNNSSDALTYLNEKWINISVLEDAEHIEICITDSGKGISPAVQEKLFQPFFTTKDIGQGTGLGLSVSSGIIKSHGGEIHLDKQSANTRFVIRLPKWQARKANERTG